MKVTKYTSNDKGGALLAYFSIVFTHQKYGEMFHNEMKLFQSQKNGHRWVSFVDKKYQNQQNETKYYPYSGFLDRAGSDLFQKDVLDAIDEFCKTNPGQSSITTQKPPQSNAMGQISEPPIPYPLQYKDTATNLEECPF